MSFQGGSNNVKTWVKSLPIAATFVLGLGAATASHAQTTAEVQKPLSIKVGANFPSNSDARNVEGNTTISAGLDYAFVKTNQYNPTLPSVYFDYAGGSKNGGHVNTYGLGVAVRQYTTAPSGNNERGVSPYIGAGIGAYFNNIKNSSGDSGNNTVFGGKVFGGVEFSGNAFVEANYQFIGASKGVNPSGLGVQVGLRF